jgi:hypothetical protein
LKFRFNRVPRPFPLGAVLGLVGGVALAGYYFLLPLRIPGIGGCRLRSATGWPCPTCGGSRSIFALFHGHVGESFLQNPMVFTGILVLAGWFLVSLWTEVGARKEMSVELTRGEKILLRVLVMALPLGNWAYLAVRAGKL